MRHGAGDHAAFQAGSGHPRADLERRVEWRTRLLVGHELQRGEHTDATHLAHQRMALEGLTQLLVEVGANIGGVGGDVFLLQDIQVGQRSGGADRMARVGPTMAHGAIAAGGFFDHVPHLLADDHR